MRSQRLKDLYYLTAGKLSLASYYWNRLRPGRFQCSYVNLGCGPDYVEGMVNVDGNLFRKKDLWLDVTFGLPFADDSVAGIYTSHMVEHLDAPQVRNLFRECLRALKPGGTLRIVVPSLAHAVHAYQANQPGQLPDWPENYKSIGGRFNNFLLVANQHKLMFDFSFLEEFLAEAGFEEIEEAASNRSRCFQLHHMQFEHKGDGDTSLYVEAVKGGHATSV